MKTHTMITVSGISGARYYKIKHSTRQYMLAGVVAVAVATPLSVYYNYVQHTKFENIYSRYANFDQELEQIDIREATVDAKIASDLTLAKTIDWELEEIERIAGMKHGNVSMPVAERIRAISQFYRQKEDEYSEIDNRIDKIEDVVGLPDKEIPAKTRENLAARVDLIALNVQQEKILRRNVPNGYPTDSKIITSKYGYRIHPVTKLESFHQGVDLRGKLGANIYATADGIVRTANHTRLSGNRIIVAHNYGFESYYAHLKGMNVKVGDIVQKGDLVGFAGNTGKRVSGPHLHYEIHYLGKPINPFRFLKWESGSNEIFTKVEAVKWRSLISLINNQITQQTLQLSLLGPTLPEKSK